MIFTSPAFLSLKESNFWITASATPMPVAYGCMVVSTLARVRKGSMRCVAGARRRRINQRVRGSDARVGVSAGENVEFFSKSRAAAAARVVCVSASATLLAAPRRREECLSAMAALQTRAARRAGQSQLGPALCLQAQATGGPRISFSEALVDRYAKAAPSSLTHHP
ncbi:unnamed protein product [Pelagomonas calceolata]|uniref:Uncharacterized protein n=1 Tax=Pelagomonas calceolata TaxID=35677 RepID=A0A8J2SDH1_9STRA|nr:unnamed protein product [Pelagomonas calceolata]|mmetsp:Transcript_13379/g.36717  ORF Transcript_13379/g.36717 Transcript_13379/m.36717 type:complete len:167 (-) Transcript_13379:74-574(-)